MTAKPLSLEATIESLAYHLSKVPPERRGLAKVVLEGLAERPDDSGFTAEIINMAFTPPPRPRAALCAVSNIRQHGSQP